MGEIERAREDGRETERTGETERERERARVQRCHSYTHTKIQSDLTSVAIAVLLSCIQMLLSQLSCAMNASKRFMLVAQQDCQAKLALPASSSHPFPACSRHSALDAQPSQHVCLINDAPASAAGQAASRKLPAGASLVPRSAWHPAAQTKT